MKSWIIKIKNYIPWKRVFWHFQEVEKWNIGPKWVNITTTLQHDTYNDKNRKLENSDILGIVVRRLWSKYLENI